MQHDLPCTAAGPAHGLCSTGTPHAPSNRWLKQLACSSETAAPMWRSTQTLPAPVLQEGEDSMEAMKVALTFVLKWGSILAFILIPIWPPACVASQGLR